MSVTPCPPRQNGQLNYILRYSDGCAALCEERRAKTPSDLVEVEGREFASGKRGADEALRQHVEAIPGNVLAIGPAAT
jgi:hypothetical protein